MTSRTSDFHCPRCGKYMFSEYTYTMRREEVEALEAKARAACSCAKRRLLSDESRCIGKPAGPSGYQHPPECSDCLRRQAPRFPDSSYVEPPKEAPCPIRIPANQEATPAECRKQSECADQVICEIHGVCVRVGGVK